MAALSLMTTHTHAGWPPEVQTNDIVDIANPRELTPDGQRG